MYRGILYNSTTNQDQPKSSSRVPDGVASRTDISSNISTKSNRDPAERMTLWIWKRACSLNAGRFLPSTTITPDQLPDPDTSYKRVRSRSRSARDSLHQLPSPEDDHQVGDDGHDDLRGGRQRCLARYPMCELVARLERVGGDGGEEGVDGTRLVKGEKAGEVEHDGWVVESESIRPGC